MLLDFLGPGPIDNRVDQTWEQQVEGAEQVVHVLGGGATTRLTMDEDMAEEYTVKMTSRWEPQVFRALECALPDEIRKAAWMMRE